MTDVTPPEAPEPRRSPMYLYAFASPPLDLPGDLRGLADAPLHVIEHDGLAAVVSPLTSARLRPERRHLAAHQGVLRALTERASVLPVSFGVVVSNAAQLRGLIDAEAAALHEQLEHVRGRVEMAVRLTWDVPNIFAYFVESEPALRAARDALVSTNSHAAKVAAGELFGKLIAARRHDHQHRVLSAIGDLAADVAIDEPKSEQEVLRVAALVDRAKLAEFEARVHDIAAAFDTSYRFDLSGPWAPHNFVRLELSPSQIAGAA
jgi:hypothetical protein